MLDRLQSRRGALIAGVAVTAALMIGPAAAQNKAPIKIGFGQSLTGFLSPNGKQALIGAEIWRDQVNKAGGLLGRQVELVYYDDKSAPQEVPGIYTKLLDVDKVDLVVGGYATNQNAPAMPVIVRKGKTYISLFALGLNSEFHYPKYFSMLPSGPTPKLSFSEGFFQIAAAQNPKPQTVALTAEDAEFARNACEGAREAAKEYGFKVIYDKTYPPGTTDFSPIIRALQSANADLVVACSYPLSSVGILQSANELNFTPKMFGGAMVGLQATAFKDRLKAKLNGIVNYETWVPSPKLMAPAEAFFKTYQARAKSEGVDPLGYYLGGWGYAYISVLGQAVAGAKSIKDDAIADYLRKNEFKTIMGNWSYGPNGEWTKAGMLQVQYHDIKDGDGLDVWRGMSYQTVVAPADQKTGNVVYPYENARK